MQDPSHLRLLCFVVVFILCALWEYRFPRKELTQKKWYRWSNNFALVALNSVLIAALIPIAAFQAAIIASEHGWGLFNLVPIPLGLSLIICVVLLDLAIYLQHLVFHRIPWLWRLHRVHHADLDIDVTTGTRFHPIEMILSMLIKIVIVISLGVPPIAVVIFEILLNASAMFNHSNGKLPLKLDAFLRKIVVTPDMHRVHHSIIVKETHSNFGFFLSIWDVMFRTYRAQPKLGHNGVIIGIPEITQGSEQRLDKMLRQPFSKFPTASEADSSAPK
ncbi:sterol desaturase family protein [Vibrio sp. 99-70-13A1]|uniref:sterol desaturase family protein n=1 Tax=Vibrio sp. 99-70-13A1 TaxID=2607601 RepID=UPI0014936014|nr:sterol desaturase family protein [Vibrio sp. 99-70-13A1]NOH96350.1 sterol desaturase family protein [Vibrio sp. 99-70-13A1]